MLRYDTNSLISNNSVIIKILVKKDEILKNFYKTLKIEVSFNLPFFPLIIMD